MKKIFTAGFLLLSIFFILVAVKKTEHYSFSSLQISETELQALIQNRLETDRISLLDVKFDDCPLFFDKAGNRWFYSVPASRRNDISVGYLADTNNMKLAFIGDADPGKTVQLIAYTDKEYRLYQIEVTSLPLILIECETDDVPRFQTIPIKFTLFDNTPEARNPIIKSDGTIHVRGKGSTHFPKKAFKVTLGIKTPGGELVENSTALLGLRQDGDWQLYAAYDDQEKIRNVFSSNLWFETCADNNSFGVTNGMEYRFVELFLNHQYWGLYAIGYPIDAKQMKIWPEANGHFEEFLFKQRAWGPPKGDYSSLEDYLVPQFEMDEADLDYGLSIMEQYFEHLNSDLPNGLYNNDELNAIDIWLYSKLIQDMDTISRPDIIDNIIYTIKKTDTGRKIIYTPWDMDTTWGNYGGSYKIDPNNNSMEMDLNPVSVLLRTQNDPEIAEKIRQRYAELRASGWSDQTIDEMLDGFEQDIYGSGAYVRDVERWPESRHQDPELGLSRFRTFVHDRLTSMDIYIEELGK